MPLNEPYRPKDPTPFGIAVRQLRSYLNISMSEMAKEFGLSESRLSQIELGVRSISSDMCQRYINFFADRNYDVADHLWEERARSIVSDTYKIDGVSSLSQEKRELVLFLGDRLDEITNTDTKVVLKQLKQRAKRRSEDV